MSGIIIVIAGILVLGIFAMSGMKFGEKKTREEFLKEFAAFLEGKLELIEGSENSHKISFCYEGQDFVYEDVEEMGFKELAYRARLKVPTGTEFTMRFTERRVGGTKSEMFRASSVPSELKASIKVPKELKKFEIFASDVDVGNQLFQDSKILSFLKRFESADARGFPFMTIKCLDGVIDVDFRAEGRNYPIPPYRQNNTDAFESLLDNLIKMAKVISSKKGSA